MYRVTAYFKNHKVTQKFYNLYDAIDFRDSADANYPRQVKFEKIKDMREWIYNCWNVVMDHNKNPLSAIPDLQVRHMVMQILAFMWSTIFAIMILDSVYAFMYSAIGHVIFVAGVVVTVATFRQAERSPQSFNWMNGYHSHGRGRNFVIWRDKNGNPHKQPLPDNDPGGEHE